MDPLAPLISALHDESRLRVWSLVITAFGDLVQHRGGVISTARLGALMGRIGVGSGALRTALSRLGRDGWVERDRRGRTSFYRLNASGAAKFGPATQRIYAAPRLVPVDEWAMVTRLTETGPQTRLFPQAGAPADADLVLRGRIDQITEAYRQTTLEPAHRAALQALARDLQAIDAARFDAGLDAAAARMLLVHRWRRIVLRFDDPPFELLPADTPLENPRAAVAAAYLSVSDAAERWMDAGLDGEGAMPEAAPAFAQRFRDAVA